MPRPASGALMQLAEERGVAVRYADAFDKLHHVSADTLVEVLAALGEPIDRPADAVECLAARRAAPPRPPPAMVAWDGQLAQATLRSFWDRCVPQPPESAPFRSLDAGELRLVLEDGSEAGEALAACLAGPVVPVVLPFGVHRLSCGSVSAIVISAPARARPIEPGSWGVFAPTYALVDERGGETGDLTCLERLGRLAGDLGAGILSTLPLLADYSRHDAVDAIASPYSPVSRMWWNEAYLDVERAGGLMGLSASGAGRAPGTGEQPRSSHADVTGAGSRVTEALRQLSDGIDASRLAGLRSFERDRPDVRRYAAFRAATQLRSIDREAWPERWRAGDIVPGDDVPHEVVNLHILLQWLTDSQIGEVASATSARGCRLMLDLPIGCRPDGYDTWAFPSSFAGGAREIQPGRGASVGAPPDRFFGAGQDWGFRPLDPEGDRRDGYPVVRGALSHLLRHAGALRIDHVLGLQRLWWIPSGATPSDGAYVNYPADELAALACLEAWRRDAVLIGEDLGTVDPSVRQLMADHGIAGTRVGVFGLEAGRGQRFDPPAGSCALVDTHDTATFAGWLDGTDIEQRLRLGLLDATAAARARASRSAATEALLARLTNDVHDAATAHAAVLEELGRSEAGLVIATLEDLWAEHEPQNIPGTTDAHANFSRRMTRSLATIESNDDLLGPLRRLDRARAHRRPADPAVEGGRAWPPTDEGRVAS
jgi:4-alpha-glucanotransferase